MYSDDRYQSLAKHTRHYENVPFEVPEGWEWIRLEDYLLLLSGQDFPPQKYNGDSIGIPYIIGASNIDKEKLFVNRWTDEPSVISMLNDILVVCKGAGVGKIAMNDVGQVHIARQIQAIRDETGILNNQYIKICIASNISEIISNANGLIPGLKRELLLSLMIPIAPVTEQHRIVDAVKMMDSLIEGIDTNVCDLLNSISTVKSKILDLAIHGKLVPQDPNDEPAIELLKRINPKFTPCDNGHDEKKEIPDSWILCTLHDSFNITMGSSPTGDALNREKQGVEFHQGKVFFSNKNILPSDIYTTQPVKMAEPHSILLCVRAPVGTVNITDRQICIGRGLCSLMPSKSIDLQYAYYVLQTCSKELEQKATGSTFKAVSGDIVKKQLIPFPPYNEQLRIVKRIEELFAVLDEIQKSIEA